VGILRRRAGAVADELEARPVWSTRAITLIHDRETTERICADWEAAGWMIMTIDEAEPAKTGQPAHIVRVAVPPPGWPPLPE
jgi:hypothetical protein